MLILYSAVVLLDGRILLQRCWSFLSDAQVPLLRRNSSGCSDMNFSTAGILFQFKLLIVGNSGNIFPLEWKYVVITGASVSLTRWTYVEKLDKNKNTLCCVSVKRYLKLWKMILQIIGWFYFMPKTSPSSTVQDQKIEKKNYRDCLFLCLFNVLLPVIIVSCNALVLF